MSKIIIFGGSFNPVHIAHTFAACYLSSLDFDQVLVIPVYKHPYGKALAPYHHRYEMCCLAMNWIPKVSVSDIERTCCDPARSNYTFDTVNLLKTIHPTWDVHFVVGSDTAHDLINGKWDRGEELLAIAKPFIIGREGNTDDHISILPEVSSTEIRDGLKQPETPAKVSAFLPPNVLDYIKEHGLYS